MKRFGMTSVCVSVLMAAMAAPAVAQGLATARTVPWRPAEVMALAELAGDHQLAVMADGHYPSNGPSETPNPRGWVQGALFVGLAALADHSQKPEFADAVLARGQANGWTPGARPYDADDFVIGSSYLWDARHGGGDAALAPTRQRLDAVLAAPPANDLAFTGDGSGCRNRWCWADAIFMGPPVWFEMSKLTGDAKYADYAKSEFEATAKRLYDPETHLWFRDSRFFERRDIDGQKLFWSRGNGWVFAGLARSIDLLPDGDPERARMIAIFQDMAAELKSIQKPDGYWSGSLLGDPAVSLPESSGTGFFTYGMAWGVKKGLLDRAAYEPVVRKGWAALVRSVHDDGTVGYVQPIGDRPGANGYDDTQLYGTGAFLLAATAVADLELAPVQALAGRWTVTNPSGHDQPVALVSLPLKAADSQAGGWSVVADGQAYAAEYDGATLRFAMPLKAHQATTIQVVPQPAVLPVETRATLNVQDGGALQGKLVTGGTFWLRKDYEVPADHFIHDGLIAFEGLGWESDKVAYRLYLDQRNVIDIYGKTVARPILADIGQNVGDYHSMNDWGQDIFQVDQSLGMGGIGEVRDGKAAQVGPARVIGHVFSDGPVTAGAVVDNLGFDGGKANLTTRYTISAGSPVTVVDAKATGAGTMAAGLVHHSGMTVLTSGKKSGAWGYIATWGQQSLAGDNLGIALFFPEDGVATRDNDDGQTLFVTFKDPASIHYAFAATWVQDGSGVRDQAGFQAWLDATLDGFDHPAVAAEAGKPVSKRRH